MINKFFKYIIATTLAVVILVISLASNVLIVKAASPSIVYSVHCQDIGWMGYCSNNVVCGTTGQNRQMEAIKIKVLDVSGGVTYSVHAQDIGWMNWVYDDAIGGTTGQNRQIEAIKIELYGDVANSYSIQYRVHCQDIGWTDYVSDGKISGTTGQNRQIEAIQIKLVPKSKEVAENSMIGDMKDVTASFAGKTVTIQSVENGKFLCADSNLDSTPLMANRDATAGWEKFTVSALTSDGWIGFKAHNGKYLSAMANTIDVPIAAKYDNLNSWECFRIYSKGNNFYIKAQINNKLLSTRVNLSNAPVQAYADNASAWERFAIEIADQPKATTEITNNTNEFDPIWPCTNTYTITALYKYSSGSVHSCRFRYGIDIGAPYGEQVVAVEDGTVICSEYSKTSGFGNWIMIQHKNGKVSLYAHLSSRKVFVGDVVSKNQVIGAVGNTSAKYNIGAHLHFELGNSNVSGAVGDSYQEYYKTKYADKIILVQAAKKYNQP